MEGLEVGRVVGLVVGRPVGLLEGSAVGAGSRSIVIEGLMVHPRPLSGSA